MGRAKARTGAAASRNSTQRAEALPGNMQHQPSRRESPIMAAASAPASASASLSGAATAANAATAADAADAAPAGRTRAVIPDRGEFIDVLFALRRGHVLVHAGQQAGGWVLDGGNVYSSYEPLLRYELVQEFDNPEGFEHVHYFRLTPQGRAFAERAVAAWRRRPLLERLMVRLVG
jgi:hypothetical protein